MAAPAGQPLEALVKDELRGPVSELVRQLIPDRRVLDTTPDAS